MDIFQLFGKLGWDHILEGYDHLLFLLALVIRITGWRKLVGIVTAFTLTHTIAMLGVALDLVSLSSRWVEAGIAFSICFSALQNVVSETPRYKWVLAGAFGFVHGAGFSSHLIAMLKEMQTGSELVPALTGFLAGLEAGQLLFVGLVTALVLSLRFWSRLELLKTELSRAIAAVGLYLFVIRVFDL
jgi:hydrogenase/urease accessory protein HupE